MKIFQSYMDKPNRVIKIPYFNIEEFIINGGRWVYVNGKLANETFDDVINSFMNKLKQKIENDLFETKEIIYNEKFYIDKIFIDNDNIEIN